MRLAAPSESWPLRTFELSLSHREVRQALRSAMCSEYRKQAGCIFIEVCLPTDEQLEILTRHLES
jgi:hypothetical protein